jgi:transcriptional regulator with XRE-family HTH domain
VKGTWKASAVSSLRKKHKLSQGALAKLLGVGINTVWLWEQGRNNPRAKQQAGIKELSGLSGLAMRRRLAAVGLSEGRSKPGRKAGSKNKPKAAAKKGAAKKGAAKKGAAKKVVARKATKKAVGKATRKATRK